MPERGNIDYVRIGRGDRNGTQCNDIFIVKYRLERLSVIHCFPHSAGSSCGIERIRLLTGDCEIDRSVALPGRPDRTVAEGFNDIFRDLLSVHIETNFLYKHYDQYNRRQKFTSHHFLLNLTILHISVYYRPVCMLPQDFHFIGETRQFPPYQRHRDHPFRPEFVDELSKHKIITACFSSIFQ